MNMLINVQIDLLSQHNSQINVLISVQIDLLSQHNLQINVLISADRFAKSAQIAGCFAKLQINYAEHITMQIIFIFDVNTTPYSLSLSFSLTQSRGWCR